MATPISSFETIESIRFFAQLVGTEGISNQVRDKTNDYILRLLGSLEDSIARTTATASGITILENDPFR